MTIVETPDVNTIGRNLAIQPPPPPPTIHGTLKQYGELRAAKKTNQKGGQLRMRTHNHSYTTGEPLIKLYSDHEITSKKKTNLFLIHY